jgi:hypothetical protein
VRRSRGTQTVDRLERDVHGRIDPDGDIGPIEVVIDRRSDADDGKAFLAKARGAGLRAVAADHDERVDRAPAQVPDRLDDSRILAEGRRSRAAEKRAAALDDAADVARVERIEGVREETRIAVAHAENFPALRDRCAGRRADRCVHAGRIAAAR